MLRNITFLSTLLLFLSSSTTLCSARKKARIKSGNKYDPTSPVHLLVNKVGPFNNPSETYKYYSYPFCKDHHADEETLKKFDRKGGEGHKLHLGEKMTGHRLESSPYEVNFQSDIEWRRLCKKTLKQAELAKFRDAILQQYFFEFYVEDLPMWGYFGEVADDNLFDHSQQQVYIFPHLHFKLGYNKKNQIVSTSVFTQSSFKVDISDESVDELEVEFSYSVEFIKTEIEWRHRFAKYVDSKFYPHKSEVHWLSIFNSILLVLLLMSFLMLILMRVLKQDFVRYMGGLPDDLEADLQGDDRDPLLAEENAAAIMEEETGWKLLHGDVFRYPSYPSLFAAIIGVGTQLIACSVVVLGLALCGIVSTTYRGQILSATVISYNLTGFVAGYVTAQVYALSTVTLQTKSTVSGSMAWMAPLVNAILLYTVPVGAVFAYVNTVAITGGSTAAMPVSAIFTVLALSAFVGVPSTLLGNIIGRYHFRNGRLSKPMPTRTNKIPRQIPPIVWWKGPVVQILVGGCLPFSAIYIELHYIFASLWGHAIYTLFGILMLSLLLLLVVVSFISVALLYFQLQNEHHEWWWRSVFVGGSTGFFLYGYCFLYFFHRSEMGGFLQGSFFFGYMFCLSYGLFLMLGSMSWFSCFVFVKYIYGRIKSD